jgi:hypothetical protein
MESNNPSSDELNRETAEEHEETGGRFNRESGEESTAPAVGPGGPNPGDTDESEMTGSADPGTVATPEGTAEVDEDLEDRGDV